MSHVKKTWGKTPDGTEIFLHTLKNDEGFEISVATYGATLTALKVPMSDGRTIDVILGFDQLSGYLQDTNYIGATVGRVASRISQAAFELHGKKYVLDKNEGDSHLHGGKKGFSSRVWETCQAENPTHSSIKLCYSSPDGEGGYPGTLNAKVTYALLQNGLRISYKATTDKPSPVNMTAHPYFNLDGDGKNVGKHELKIFSGNTLYFDENLIPSGEILSTTGTAADFTDFKAINAIIDGNSGKPVEHDRFYPLDLLEEEMPVSAITRSPSSGLEMEVASTNPGIQLYSGDYISEGTVGKQGCIYGPRSGFCLEPMCHPDAPSRPEFPSVILNPGEMYEQIIEYRFRELS